MKYEEPNPPIFGWMNEAELQQLYEWGQQCRYVVEVGSWIGRSTHALLSSGAHVIVVDHFRGSKSEILGNHKVAADGADIFAFFYRNVGTFQNLSVLRMDSRAAAALFAPQSVDMVFIDGDHEYPEARADFEAWMDKPTRFLCGHDVRQDGVPRALKDCGLVVREIPNGSLWLAEGRGVPGTGFTVQEVRA